MLASIILLAGSCSATLGAGPTHHLARFVSQLPTEAGTPSTDAAWQTYKVVLFTSKNLTLPVRTI